jgi:excinuclease UvrABC ATPase subunit
VEEFSEQIEVLGAREHNLRNIDITFPREKLIVITGLSGSGKSSLAFDTIYAEGQRRYMETFSAYARSFLGNMERPDVDKISGLSPVISIEQKTTNTNPRSTVGTITEIYDFMRRLLTYPMPCRYVNHRKSLPPQTQIPTLFKTQHPRRVDSCFNVYANNMRHLITFSRQHHQFVVTT